MSVAFVTMVYNDEFFLDIWLRYYRKHVPAGDLYIITHGPQPYAHEMGKGCNVIEIDRSALPAATLYRAFTPGHLPACGDAVEVGSSLLVVGFPLGFHDTLHHMPVVRQAVLSSSFGLRFKGEGYFLTDARTHRGTSGAAVVMRTYGQDPTRGDLPWLLLGIHSARLDVGGRDRKLDEALGLNCAWYADILMTLTAY